MTDLSVSVTKLTKLTVLSEQTSKSCTRSSELIVRLDLSLFLSRKPVSPSPQISRAFDYDVRVLFRHSDPLHASAICHEKKN